MSNDFYTLSKTLSELVNDLNQDNLDELSKKRWSKAELSEVRGIFSDRENDLNLLYRALLNTGLETRSGSDSTLLFHDSTQYVPLYCRLIEDQSEDTEDGAENSYYIEAFTKEMIDVNYAYSNSKALLKTSHEFAGNYVTLNISVMHSKDKHFVEVYRLDAEDNKTVLTAQHINQKEANDVAISCSFNIANNDSFDVCVSFDETYSERILSMKNGKIIDNEENYSYLDFIYKPYSFAISADISDGIIKKIKDTNSMFVLKARMHNIADPDPDSTPGQLFCAASEETVNNIEIKWAKDIFAIDTGIEKKIQQIRNNLDNIFGKSEIIDFSNKSSLISRGTNNDVLGNLFTNVNTSTVQVRCVGQANAIIIKNNYKNKTKKTIAFDLGLPCYSNREKNPLGDYVNAKPLYQFDHENLSQLDLDYVFISHWHADHFLGLYSLNREFFVGTAKEKGLVIAPYFESTKSIPDQAKLLISYLIENDMIRFVKANKNVQVRIYNNDNCKLYFVNYPIMDGKKIDVNCVSLLLWMKNTLFPGDCYIGYWPPEIQKLIIERLIIPHHGSLNGNSMVPLGKNSQKVACKGKTAYVCVGNHPNKWDHPNRWVTTMYGKAYKKVYRTDGDPSNTRPVVESQNEANFTFKLKW